MLRETEGTYMKFHTLRPLLSTTLWRHIGEWRHSSTNS